MTAVHVLLPLQHAGSRGPAQQCASPDSLRIGHNNKEMPPQLLLFVRNTSFVLIKIQAYEVKTFLHHAVMVPEAETLWNIV
jgi:hypothetical protein